MHELEGWDTTKQEILNLYALLSDATDRELRELPDSFRADEDLKRQLRDEWTHVCAGLFLVGIFSMLESRDLDQVHGDPTLERERQVLKCLRNAFVHNGDHLRQNNDQSCFENTSRFRDEIGASRISYDGAYSVMPYFDIADPDRVRLRRAAFDRILTYAIEQVVGAAGRF